MELFYSPGIEIKFNDSSCWFQNAMTVAIEIKIKNRKVKFLWTKTEWGYSRKWSFDVILINTNCTSRYFLLFFSKFKIEKLTELVNRKNINRWNFSNCFLLFRDAQDLRWLTFDRCKSSFLMFIVFLYFS